MAIFIKPNSIGVKYSLIVLGGGEQCTPCPCFDLLIGEKIFLFYFELKLSFPPITIRVNKRASIENVTDPFPFSFFVREAVK